MSHSNAVELLYNCVGWDVSHSNVVELLYRTALLVSHACSNAICLLYRIRSGRPSVFCCNRSEKKYTEKQILFTHICFEECIYYQQN